MRVVVSVKWVSGAALVVKSRNVMLYFVSLANVGCVCPLTVGGMTVCVQRRLTWSPWLCGPARPAPPLPAGLQVSPQLWWLYGRQAAPRSSRTVPAAALCPLTRPPRPSPQPP